MFSLSKNSIPKIRIPKLYLIYLLLFLFCCLLLLIFINFSIEFWSWQNRIQKVPFAVSTQAQLPAFKLEYVPQISARGAIIMDADSKVVLFSKNPYLRFSSASTTKIMTALTALDYLKLNDVITVKQVAVEGSALGLTFGQQFTFESLMYAMFLPSANDAALAIAQNYKDGEKAFVEKMNNKAQSLNLLNTHYLDPAGLEDSGNYTTPFDLARLASFAITNLDIKKAVGTKQRYIYDLNGNSYNIENLNKLLGVNGVNGIKTGYTEEAGQVLVTSKLENGKTIIIVVMGSENRFLDTSVLLDLVTNNITYLSIHP